MKAATANEIKQRLKDLDKKDLMDLCLRLSRYKKENKELLTFLLFESDDLPHYINSVKEELDETFAAVNTSSVFFAKKTIRKALRTANRYIRYAGDKTVETEVLLHFCTNFQELKLDWKRSTLLAKIYYNQIKKIDAAIVSMHEDLQYDYRRSYERLK
ncbi:MAG TPA: hypothetical protein VGN63_18440 [Flavisolibacter sp.]|jgi:hypothetical protein|nr:hypothetical protein [Flavisolibacter sp.]